MMMAFVLLLALATAAPPVQGIDLYDGLKSGMSKDEAKQALTSEEKLLTRNCQVRIKLNFRDGLLSSVVLRNKWKLEKADCLQPITRALMEKYGSPVAIEQVPALTNFDQPGQKASWLDDHRLIELTAQGHDTILVYKSVELVPDEEVEGL